MSKQEVDPCAEPDDSKPGRVTIFCEKGEPGKDGGKGPRGIRGLTGTKGNDGGKGSDGDQGPIGDPGPPGAGTGDPATYEYEFDGTSIVMGDPGAGKFRLNNGTQPSSTSIAISKLDFNGNSISGLLAAFSAKTSNIKGTATMIDHNTGQGIWWTTTAIVDNGTWFQLTVAVTQADIVMVDTNRMLMVGSLSGDKGDTGPDGADGGDGAPGSAGDAGTFEYEFDSNIVMADPGAGKWRGNNATLTSATSVAISKTDLQGNTITGLGTAIAGVTGDNKAELAWLDKANTRGFLATVTTITDNGTWFELVIINPTFSPATPLNTDQQILAFGVFGDAGAPGGTGVTTSWKFKTPTADADPGIGNFRLNTGAFATTTKIWVDVIDQSGVDVTILLSSLEAGERLYVQKEDDSTVAGFYTLDSDAVDKTGYYELNVTFVDEGSGGFLSNNDDCAFVFTAIQIVTAHLYEFDSSTVAADPGPGKFRLNNADPTLATFMYIDDTNLPAAIDLGSTLEALNEHSQLYVGQLDDPDKTHLYSLTGDSVDSGGFWTLPISHNAGGVGGLFTAGNRCSILHSSNPPQATETVRGISEFGTEAETALGSTVSDRVVSVAVAPLVDQKRSHTYDDEGGINDSYSIGMAPVVLAYVDGQIFQFKAGTTNIGAATLEVDALGARPIRKHFDQVLDNGDIQSGQMVTVQYDGANSIFQMLSQPGNATVSDDMVIRLRADLTDHLGGGSGSLDGVITASGKYSAIDTTIMFFVPTGGNSIVNLWRLQAGVDAEDLPGGIIRPDDYAASTNEKVWKKEM